MLTSCLHVLVVVVSAPTFVVLLVRGEDGTGVDSGCNDTCDYTAWALDADCRGLGLVSVPSDCSASQILDLRNNHLDWLEQGALLGYASLVYLDVEFNAITGIDEGAFDGCSSLRYIYLQYNNLQRVGPGAFRGAAALEWLFLNQNSITSVDRDAFHGLDKLERLYMGNNNLGELDESVFRSTPELRYLHIAGNGLEDLPVGILRPLRQLLYLNLEENRLASLDGRLFEGLKSLSEISLAGNRLAAVTSFPTLPQLGVLDLSENNLTNLSALDWGLVGRLSKLYLGGNANVKCTCSAVAVQDWLVQHRSAVAVDPEKANVMCRRPETLRGLPLLNVSRDTLCPGSKVGVAVRPDSPPVPTTNPSSTKLPQPPNADRSGVPAVDSHLIPKGDSHLSRAGDSNPIPAGKSGAVLAGKSEVIPADESDSEPVPQQRDGFWTDNDHQTLVYIGVGVATLVVITLVLLFVLQCMKAQTRRYYHRAGRHDVELKPPPQSPPPPPPPPEEISPSQMEEADAEDPLYEPIGGNGYPRRQHADSAFSSLEDIIGGGDGGLEESLANAQRLPMTNPDREPCQGYVTMEGLLAMQQSAPDADNNDNDNESDDREGAPEPAGAPPGMPYLCLVMTEAQANLLAKNAACLPLGMLSAPLTASARPLSRPRPHQSCRVPPTKHSTPNCTYLATA